MKQVKIQYPLLVSDDKDGFNDAVRDFESKVFPYIKTVKGFYDSLQLTTPFNDSIYVDLVTRQGNSITEMVDEKIKNLPHVIGMDHMQSMFAGRKASTGIINQIQIETQTLKEAYGRTHFKGRVFPLSAVINVDTTPEISPEARQNAAESFRTYIHNEEEQETFDMLHNFGAMYNLFIRELQSKGYKNAGIGQTGLADFYTETHNNELLIREDAIGFIRGLSV
jgi:hypothetical protein